MIKVDIATKIVAPETSIWVVFPGRARRNLKIFLGNDAIFLETPGINLTPQIAGNVAAIRQRVRMSSAIGEYLRGTGPTEVPSRILADYSDGPLDSGSQTVLAANVRKMFGKMKKGDLVIVPDHLFLPVHFAEVTSDFLAKDVLTIDRYPNEEVPVRRVRWLNSGVPRNLIPPDLQQTFLSKPPAISYVGRSFQTDEFFRLAYPAFILAEKSAILIDGPRYSGHNPLATHEANHLVAYYIAAFAAIEQDRLPEFSRLDVQQAIAKFFDEDLVQSFTQNYNSPGQSALSARSAILGAFVSVGIAVALTGLAASHWKDGVEVTNSVSPSDEHTKDSAIKLDFLFKSLSKDKIDELKELAKKSKKNIGLRTPVKVESGTP
jgi:hypothetical protein